VTVPETWRDCLDPVRVPSGRCELPSRGSLETFAEGARARFLRRAASGAADPDACRRVLLHEQAQAEAIAMVLRMRPEGARRRAGIVLSRDFLLVE